jgi:lipoate-protein ligase A
LSVNELWTYFVPACDAARFVRIAMGLLPELERDRQPRLVLAELLDDSVLLGRFQRAASTIDLDRAGSVIRRLGGGRALSVGHGVLGVLLGLPDLAALLDKPIGPEKLLNRYVRGLLAGISACGAGTGAHYFGRDFVSAERREVAALSQDGSPSGAVLLEAFVGVSRTLELAPGYARFRAHTDPRSSGPAHATLSDLAQRAVAIEELARAIASGYAKVHKCALAWKETPVEAAAPEPPVLEMESAFRASGPFQVPIGFVEALVRTESNQIVEARVRGDFIAPAFTIRALEASLTGCPISAEQVGLRIDAAFRAPGAMILGVTALQVFADAILAAASP